MKNFACLVSVFLLAITLNACAQSSYQRQYSSGIFDKQTVKASNNYVTKEMKVKDFNEIKVMGGMNVSYTQQPHKHKVEIYTSDNVTDLLDIYVKNGCLNIGFKKNVSVKYNKLEIRVTSARLNHITIIGSGDFELTNGLKTDDLSINVTGSGDFTGNNIQCTQNLSMNIAGSGDIEGENFSAEALKMSIAGSGDLNIKGLKATNTKASVAGSGTMRLHGHTQNAIYSVAGSGDLLASDLEAQNVEASVSGSGDIKCYAVKYLKARTSGSGEIGYKGDPEVDYPYRKLYKL